MSTLNISFCDKARKILTLIKSPYLKLRMWIFTVTSIATDPCFDGVVNLRNRSALAVIC